MKVVTSSCEGIGVEYIKIYPKNSNIFLIELYNDKMVLSVKDKNWDENHVLHEKKFVFRDLLIMHKALTKIFARKKWRVKK